MTRGTITNKQTGLEIMGRLTSKLAGTIAFNVEGSTGDVYLHSREWDYTPEPEPIKNGVYALLRAPAETARIVKHVSGEWQDADGYTLANQDVDVSRLVRLVPEA